VSTFWLIAVLAAGTVALKAVGPLLAGGRRPPAAVRNVIALLAPALVTALVVAGTVGGQGRLVVDARLAGVAVGAAALWLRLPLTVALVLAASACALTRALT
jgi:hypothetical protein